MEYRGIEQEMYKVMSAVCDSGIPIDFKGAMVLHAYLYENGYSGEGIRPTKDIDANWISDTPPTMEQITSSLQKAIDDKDIDLVIKPFRSYGEGRSAGFDFMDKDTSNVVFTMDMDVNRPESGLRLYEVGEFKFYGVVVEQMLADKISVVSSDKVFRRIKDVIDLYYLSKCCEIKTKDIKSVLERTNRKMSDFNAFLNRKEELEHSYSKFRFDGDMEKPNFEKVYDAVNKYISDFIYDIGETNICQRES